MSLGREKFVEMSPIRELGANTSELTPELVEKNPDSFDNCPMLSR